MHQTATLTPSWSLLEKIGFRFFFLFFFPQLFEALFSIFLHGGSIGDFYQNMWDTTINWAGRTFFNIPKITIRPNGSGDTTWNWVQLFLISSTALIGTVVWSVADRKRPHYHSFNYWFCVLLRFYLGITMLSYGFAKVFFSQFGTITTYRLFEQLGDMSPMGLLWTFMAFSKGYQFFTGMGEVIGGFLLFFRRTTLLGSLIIVAVMSNVVMLNFFYDVPVKIFSSQLLLAAFYLIAPDVKRLLYFFVLNQPAPAREYPLFSSKQWFKWGRIGLKTLLIGSYVIMGGMQGYQSLTYQESPQSALYGPYEVVDFKKNNQIASSTDTLRWERVFVDRRGSFDMISITNSHGLQQRIGFEYNQAKHSFTLKEWYGDDKKYPFSYTQPDSSTLFLRGKWKDDSLSMKLQKIKKPFLLTSRGFHWINETPFNK